MTPSVCLPLIHLYFKLNCKQNRSDFLWWVAFSSEEVIMNDLTPESTVVMVPKSVRRGLGRATVVSITPSNVAKLLIWDFKWALVHWSDIRQQLCRRRKSGFRVKRVFFFCPITVQCILRKQCSQTRSFCYENSCFLNGGFTSYFWISVCKSAACCGC